MTSVDISPPAGGRGAGGPSPARIGVLGIGLEAYWPQFERRFPIIVYPGEATMRVAEPASAVPAPHTAGVVRPPGPRRAASAGVSA